MPSYCQLCLHAQWGELFFLVVSFANKGSALEQKHSLLRVLNHPVHAFLESNSSHSATSNDLPSMSFDVVKFKCLFTRVSRIL
jgi:hypothetical protein